MSIEINCFLIKYRGYVTGISLIPEDDQIAKNFCQSITRHLMSGKPCIKLEDDVTLCFVNDNIEVSFELSNTEGEEIAALLEEELMLCSEQRFGPGIRLTRIGKERLGEKYSLIRVEGNTYG